MKRYMQYIIESTEKRVDTFLATQDKNPGSLQYGGIRSDIWEAKPTIYMLANAVAVYLNPQSRYYQSPQLFEAMHLALQFVRNNQREDGSFDYPSCNFKSTPDTAFCFKRLVAAYRLLQNETPTPETEALKRKYLVIMQDALKAICVGGFHTPNHRWGIAAALMQGITLFAENTAFTAQMQARLNQYLAEGIDIDEDGEYAERSTGNYNAVVNNAMMAMFEESGNTEYFDTVQKNLSMMLYYIDPDDTIFTQNSTRQDMGKQDYPDKYFYQYLWVCSQHKNPLFDGVAHKIIQDCRNRGALAPEVLHILMAHPAMANYQFKEYGYLQEYSKFFPHSGVLRVRRGNFCYTLLRGKSTFLYMQQGEARLHVKIGESYGPIRNFIPQTITVQQGKAVLHASESGWYYHPFETPPDTSDWWQMDHTARSLYNATTLETTLTVTEVDGGLAFRLKTTGVDRLPLRVEVGVPAGATLSSDSFWQQAAAGGSMILRAGSLTVQAAGQQLVLGEGFGEHEFQGHYSGEEINAAGFTVYLNAYTPLEKEFRLVLKKQGE